MGRKESIFTSFINHELIVEKYNISKGELPQNLSEGLKSNYSIIKAIALIVDKTEKKPVSDKALYGQITQFLNGVTIWL